MVVTNVCVVEKSELGFDQIVVKPLVDLYNADFENFRDKMCAPMSNEKTGEIVGLTDCWLTCVELEYILDLILPKNAQFRNTLVDYYDLDVSGNNLTPRMIIQKLYGKDGLTSGKRDDHSDILDMLELYSFGKKTMKIVAGDNVVVEDSTGIVARVYSDPMHYHELRIFFVNDGKQVMLLDETEVEDLEEAIGDMDISKIASLSTKNIKCKVKSVFELVGHLDLSHLAMPSKVTKAWIDKVCKELGGNIDTKGKSDDQIVDEVYEVLNTIAGDRTVKEIFFLLPDEYVKQVGLDRKAKEKMPEELAIAIMARRHGNIILKGSPLFDETTLKDGAKWNIARLVKK